LHFIEGKLFSKSGKLYFFGLVYLKNSKNEKNIWETE
jgi:hypothetical protein